MPDPEVRERPVRRTFTAEYKLRIVEEANAAREPGAVVGLLRREGLYSSHLVEDEVLGDTGHERRSLNDWSLPVYRRNNSLLSSAVVWPRDAPFACFRLRNEAGRHFSCATHWHPD